MLGYKIDFSTNAGVQVEKKRTDEKKNPSPLALFCAVCSTSNLGSHREIKRRSSSISHGWIWIFWMLSGSKAGQFSLLQVAAVAHKKKKKQVKGKKKDLRHLCIPDRVTLLTQMERVRISSRVVIVIVIVIVNRS